MGEHERADRRVEPAGPNGRSITWAAATGTFGRSRQATRSMPIDSSTPTARPRIGRDLCGDPGAGADVEHVGFVGEAHHLDEVACDLGEAQACTRS